jgi:hypothetical protein
MAKAARQPTLTWIPFQAGCDLGLGQRWLLSKLKAGLVRWRARDVEPPGASLDEFWQDPEPTLRPDGSWLKTVVSQVPGDPEFDTVTVFGIEVAREGIEALLAPEPRSDRPPRGSTERWVYDEMKRNPPRKGDHDYTGRLHERRPDKTITLKTIQNLVSRYRAQFELPAEIPASSRRR